MICFPRQSLFVVIILGCSLSACEAPEPRDERPNILFAIADDASFPHMGAYGTDWVDTPAFDQVAREGLLFTRAYTPNAKCAPSRSIILTGRNSWQLEEAANHWPYFPAKFKTYVESLGENGYHVGSTAKGWAPGVALDAEGNRRELTGKKYNEHKLEPPARFISDNDYAANFEAFLEDNTSNEPFAFWYGAIEPHRAYEFGAGRRLADKQLDEIDHVPGFWPDTDSVRTDMLDYAYEIEYFDQHLARMLVLLEERGELENTVVVVTADNGMPFPRIKGQSYEMSNHLPLAIMWPRGIQEAGRVVDSFVSFADFTPTFMEIAGLDPVEQGMHPVEGRSLIPLLTNSINIHRDHVLIGKERHDIGRPNDGGYPMRGIVKDDLLFIRNFEITRWPAGNPETGYLNCDGSPTKTICLQARFTNDHNYWALGFGKRAAEELYNIKQDPDCMNNLADDPRYAVQKTEMNDELVAGLTQQQDPRILGNGEIFDGYQYADTKHKGFYEKYMAGTALETGWVNKSDFDDRGE